MNTQTKLILWEIEMSFMGNRLLSIKSDFLGVPAVAQPDLQCPCSARTQIQSPAWHNGLVKESSVATAVTKIQYLAQEFPYVVGMCPLTPEKPYS